MSDTEHPPLGPAGRVAHAFINSKLTPLVVITSVLLGLFAVIMLPREEEPQIKVPMVDVMVAMPGFSAREVEERAIRGRASPERLPVPPPPPVKPVTGGGTVEGHRPALAWQ